MIDVCGGLISEEETIIPIHHWLPPTMNPSDATSLFLASDHDTYANYTVYLCAQTLGVLFRRTSSSTTIYPGSPDDNSESYVARWSCLFDAVEQWYENRPSQMKSIFSVSTATAADWGRERAFPTVLYANGAASMFYNLFSLGFFQRVGDVDRYCSFWEPAVPHMLTPPPPAETEDAFAGSSTGLSSPPLFSLYRHTEVFAQKSVLWHARQICAISASNAHQYVSTSLLPLHPLYPPAERYILISTTAAAGQTPCNHSGSRAKSCRTIPSTRPSSRR
jgi:hypothetical protein